VVVSVGTGAGLVEDLIAVGVALGVRVAVVGVGDGVSADVVTAVG
jgi:hypothetical protein